MAANMEMQTFQGQSMRAFYPAISRYKAKWHLQEGNTGKASCSPVEVNLEANPWVDEGQCEAAIPAWICRRCLQKL